MQSKESPGFQLFLFNSQLTIKAVSGGSVKDVNNSAEGRTGWDGWGVEPGKL